MKSDKGFTLIELLIALTIFAILASITSSTLYYAFTTRTRVNEQSERLSGLQLAASLMQQDTAQTIGRAIRGTDLRVYPIFTGQAVYMEFTRDGDANPAGNDKRSTLKRIAYVCQDHALYRRTWDVLDPIERKTFHDKLLLGNLNSCHFAYFNQNLQSFPEWRADAVSPNQNKEALPKAVQINLTLKDMGKINLLFSIPESLYAST